MNSSINLTSLSTFLYLLDRSPVADTVVVNGRVIRLDVGRLMALIARFCYGRLMQRMFCAALQRIQITLLRGDLDVTWYVLMKA